MPAVDQLSAAGLAVRLVYPRRDPQTSSAGRSKPSYRDETGTRKQCSEFDRAGPNGSSQGVAVAVAVAVQKV